MRNSLPPALAQSAQHEHAAARRRGDRLSELAEQHIEGAGAAVLRPGRRDREQVAAHVGLVQRSLTRRYPREGQFVVDGRFLQ